MGDAKRAIVLKNNGSGVLVRSGGGNMSSRPPPPPPVFQVDEEEQYDQVSQTPADNEEVNPSIRNLTLKQVRVCERAKDEGKPF